jgi:hypothetical protein
MSTKTKTTTKTAKAKAKPAGQPKKPTRHEQLEALLRRPEGATIAQVQEVFGILPHSARAQISMLGKKLGTKIESERAAKGEPLVYRLPAAD